MKIYTKTGDRGQTSLYGGIRVTKNHIRVDSYGNVDELNSFLGICLTKIENKKISDFVKKIQEDLFLIGSVLSGASGDLSILGTRVREMEKMIDELDIKLPRLKNFVIPGGNDSASFLFYARAITRRCERTLVALSQKEPIDMKLLIYFNRLSDLLFELARFVNFKNGKKEIIWKRKSA